MYLECMFEDPGVSLERALPNTSGAPLVVQGAIDNSKLERQYHGTL